MAEGEGGKEAFCLLLWRASGGQFSAGGKPLFERSSNARGSCTRPFDCFQCAVMQEELAHQAPGEAIWICPDCIDDAVKASKDAGIPYLLPGHFTEGQCQYQHCSRPARVEEGVELPRGFSRFLQIFIGAVNNI